MKAQAFICKSQPLLKRERIGGFQGPKVRRRVFTISCSRGGKILKPWKGKSPSKDRKGKAVERRETFGETDLGLKH